MYNGKRRDNKVYYAVTVKKVSIGQATMHHYREWMRHADKLIGLHCIQDTIYYEFDSNGVLHMHCVAIAGPKINYKDCLITDYHQNIVQITSAHGMFHWFKYITKDSHPIHIEDIIMGEMDTKELEKIEKEYAFDGPEID